MFRFEHPEWIYLALIALPVWLLFRYRAYRQNLDWQKLGDDAVLSQFVQRRHSPKGILMAMTTILLSIGIANPQWGHRTDLVRQSARDIYIAVDLSSSMQVRDVAPNRLDRAKLFVRQLLPELQGDRIGIIYFACNAYLEMPLTSDLQIADMMIQTTSANKALAQGTALPAALDLALAARDQNEESAPIMLLITDGEDHAGGAPDAAENFRAAGGHLITVGVGTISGGLVPKSGSMSRYILDKNDQPVRSQLREKELKKIAQSGGGQYFRLGQSDEMIVKAIRDVIDKIEGINGDERAFVRAESYFQPFLIAAFALLLVGIRRSN